ncbi:hypothetical protein [Labrys monachus]|uniref:Uncharacterized protein n=1 Tax=Labrys monachus TaxID=217067 RepID=A0ABU0FK41_9HYPH|nr:hypothetical protein [Labrys monachus]MDQ0394484.1 hypothetical protein [Labrys monachus]
MADRQAAAIADMDQASFDFGPDDRLVALQQRLPEAHGMRSGAEDGAFDRRRSPTLVCRRKQTMYAIFSAGTERVDLSGAFFNLTESSRISKPHSNNDLE